MAIGLVGRKAGMTRMFTDAGDSVPVTVIEVEPNRITQVMTDAKEGYRAYQVTVGSVKASRVSKPEAGHFAKASVEAGRGLWEFRLDEGEGSDLAAGGEVSLDIFAAGQKVDVQGNTIGKGFAGVVKRYGFAMQDATHGNSISHRAPGSIGQNQTPGRVFKGKKMAGHMGAVRRTVQNLEVVKIDPDKRYLLIKGAVPGSRGGNVIICPSVKA
jgi:large subunit ribosomal protein L3